MIKICEYCKKEYKTDRSSQKYCSRDCRNKSMSTKIECVCENCGKLFLKKKDEYNKHNHHFCSKECHYNFHYEIIVCKNCGKEKRVKKGKNQIFCSHSCAVQYNSTHQKTNKEIIICKYCGKYFESQVSNHREFCSQSCAYEWRKENKTDTDYNKVRRKHAKQKFYYKFSVSRNDIELLSEYINATTKIHCRCIKHGNEFFMLPDKILSGQSGCKKCVSSKGEQIIYNFCNDNNINFIQQKRFENCKDINTLPYDFYLPNLNIAIEYDGEHHYKPVNWGGISNEQAKYNFEITKMHDQIKTDYCKKNNIKLIRIPYYKKDNIEDILNKEILLKVS